jgi:hypothetical protein
MKRTTIWLLCAIALVFLLAFARYETIAPCGMLRAQIKRHVLTETAKSTSGSGLELVGVALGVALVDKMIEAYTASLGPLDCAYALAKLEINGDLGSLRDRIAESAQQSSVQQVPATYSKPPEWVFITTQDPITDKVFERATILSDNSSFWIYLRSNSLYAGFAPRNSVSARATEFELRVDDKLAFNLRPFNIEDGKAFVTLTEAQVEQIKTGHELLIRYDGLSGKELVSLPLTNAAEAIEKVGKPTKTEKPAPSRAFSKMSIDQQFAYWKKQHHFGTGDVVESNSRQIWDGCSASTQSHEDGEGREKLLECITRHMPLE